MEKYIGRELERRRYFEVENFKKEKGLWIFTGTAVEAILDNDLFLRELLENRLDPTSGWLGKPMSWLRVSIKKEKREKKMLKNFPLVLPKFCTMNYIHI